MKRMILNNWTLKLLSVVIAIIVWLIVVNYDNPYQTRTISGIPIEVVNEDVILDNDMTYTVTGNQTATIRVRCPRKVAQNLRAADFKAEADFNNLYSLTNQVPVRITCINNKVIDEEITQITNSMEVELEQVTSQRIDVKAKVSGEPSSGYQVGQVSCSPAFVTVKGTQSMLDQIGSVGVEVNVDGVSQNMTSNAPLQFYNAGGSSLDADVVSALTVSTNNISVEVEILNVKMVNIGYNVTGQDAVAEGYRYSGIEVNPTSVQVSGRKSVLAEVTSLDLPEGELDVTGASEDITKTFDLRELLPEGVTLVDETAYEVTVDLRVEQLQRKIISIPLSEIILENLDENLRIVNEGATLPVTVEGLGADLDELTSDEISATVDLRDKEAGTHTVAAEVEVPSGFNVVGTASIRLELAPPVPSTAPGVPSAAGGGESQPKAAGETGIQNGENQD